MFVCSVVGCGFQSNDKNIKQLLYEAKHGRVSFFNFPLNPERRQLWIDAMQRPEWTPKYPDAVCSLHFKPEQIDTNNPPYIWENTVPNIFPDLDSYVVQKDLKPHISKGVTNSKVQSSNSLASEDHYYCKKDNNLESQIDDTQSSLNSGLSSTETKYKEFNTEFLKYVQRKSSEPDSQSEYVSETEEEITKGEENIAPNQGDDRMSVKDSSVEEPQKGIENAQNLKAYLRDDTGLVCRICLGINSQSPKFEIFPEDKRNEDVARKFRSNLEICFPELDLDLIKKPLICMTCYARIDICFKLKAKIKKTEETLKEILKVHEQQATTTTLFYYRPTPVPKAKTGKHSSEIVHINKTKSKPDPQPIVEEAPIEKESVPEPTLHRAEACIRRLLKNNPNLMDTSFNELLKDEAPVSEQLKKCINDTYHNEHSLKGHSPWLCDYCGIFYDGEKHRLNCSMPKSSKVFTCDICQTTAPSLPTLMSHKALKHGPFNCKHCNDVFVNINERRQHIRDVHPEMIKIYQCEHCGKCYRTSEMLKSHKELHEDTFQNRFNCLECGKRFRNRNTLRKHKQFHLNQNREFACPYCKTQQIRSQESLDKHIKIYHENEPENLCTLCGEHFWKFRSLRFHMDKKHGIMIKERSELESVRAEPQHTEASPDFVCHICDKRFHYNRMLEQHIKGHLKTASADYVCQYCNSTRMQSQESLERHIKIFHENQPEVTCFVCGKSFWKFINLKQHLEKVHNVVVNSKKDVEQMAVQYENEGEGEEMEQVEIECEDVDMDEEIIFEDVEHVEEVVS